MTPLIIGAALALLALDSAPATAPPTEVKPAIVSGQKSDNTTNDLDKVVCKNQPLTGSRFSKRVCMTKLQWGEQERQTEILERRLNQTATPTGGGGFSGG